MYKCYDRNTNSSKRSTKGIPHNIDLELSQFKSCLLNTAPRELVEINSLRKDHNNKMCRMKTQKRGLSDIFVKLRVAKDKITCTPLEIDGKFI